MTDDQLNALRALSELEPGSPRLWELLDASGLMSTIEQAVRKMARQCGSVNRYRAHGRSDHDTLAAELLASVLLYFASGALGRMARTHAPVDLPPLVFKTTLYECRRQLFPRYRDGARLVLDVETVQASVTPELGVRERAETLLGQAELEVWRDRAEAADREGRDKAQVEAQMRAWARCKLSLDCGLTPFDELAAALGVTENTLRQRYRRADRRLYLDMARQLGALVGGEPLALAGLRRARRRGYVSPRHCVVLTFWTGACARLEGSALADLSADPRWLRHDTVNSSKAYRDLAIEGRRAIGKAARRAADALARAHTRLIWEESP